MRRSDLVPDRDIQRARRLARVLDHGLVDPLLGLFLPGVGDLVGAALGLYLVVIALRRHVSPVVVARMLINLGTDALVGAIPILGDAFDFVFHANQRNLALLVARSASGGRATARDWLVLAGVVVGFLAVLALICWGVVALVRAL